MKEEEEEERWRKKNRVQGGGDMANGGKHNRLDEKQVRKELNTLTTSSPI